MKTRRRALFTLLAGTAVLTGCASPHVTDYAPERPLAFSKSAMAQWPAALPW